MCNIRTIMDKFHFKTSLPSNPPLPEPKRTPWQGYTQFSVPDVAATPDEQPHNARWNMQPRWTRPANFLGVSVGKQEYNPGGKEYCALALDGSNTHHLKIRASAVIKPPGAPFLVHN